MTDSLVQIGNKVMADAVQVKTFGGFSVTYMGNEISFGAQNESQIVILLQLLLHFRDKGITRELAKAELFGDREVDDVSHSIRNIIYNLRKKLRELGFPQSQFVLKKGGVYIWADDVPVYEDATEFELLLSDAAKCSDDAEKKNLLLRALRLYTGRFLADNESSVWTVAEAERYRGLLGQCVNMLCDILRQEHDYQLMYETGQYAADVDPFNEWEIISLEALSGMGSFDQTEIFFRDTVDKYTDKFGGTTNSYLRAFVNRLGMKLVIGYESFEDIQEKMRDKSPHYHEGYFCSLPVFQEIYRITERLLERTGDRIFLMLCTILDSKGNPMLTGSRLEDLSARLKEAIVSSVRYTDTITRYGNGQYLVLLINTSYEDCSVIASRINSKFIRNGQKTSVRYTVNNVVVSSDSSDRKEGYDGARDVKVK